MQEKLEMAISITTVIISGISLLVTIGGGVWAVCTYISGLRRERKQATLDAFNLLQEQVLDKLNTYDAEKIENIAKTSSGEEYKALTVLLARWEHFCVGVNSRIYDKKTVKRLAGKYLIGLYGKVKPLIEKKRESKPEALHYDEMEKMIKELEKEYLTKKHGGKKNA